MTRVEAAIAAYERAKAEHDAIVDRYNTDYRAGLFTTNRELAGRGENAYDVMVAAEQAVREARCSHAYGVAWCKCAPHCAQQVCADCGAEL